MLVVKLIALVAALCQVFFVVGAAAFRAAECASCCWSLEFVIDRCGFGSLISLSNLQGRISKANTWRRVLTRQRHKSTTQIGGSWVSVCSFPKSTYTKKQLWPKPHFAGCRYSQSHIISTCHWYVHCCLADMHADATNTMNASSRPLVSSCCQCISNLAVDMHKLGGLACILAAFKGHHAA